MATEMKLRVEKRLLFYEPEEEEEELGKIVAKEVISWRTELLSAFSSSSSNSTSSVFQ